MKPNTGKPQGGLLSRLKNQEDPREPGWKTLEELIADDPMPRTTARMLLNAGIAAGTIETGKMKSPTKKGLAIRLNYREKS